MYLQSDDRADEILTFVDSGRNIDKPTWFPDGSRVYPVYSRRKGGSIVIDSALIDVVPGVHPKERIEATTAGQHLMILRGTGIIDVEHIEAGEKVLEQVEIQEGIELDVPQGQEYFFETAGELVVRVTSNGDRLDLVA